MGASEPPAVIGDDPESRGPGPGFFTAAVAVITSIPAGEVSTYGEVAREAGYPGAARAVGHILATTPDLPWWRVVAASGRLVPGHEAEHARRLAAEGVGLRNGKVRFPSLPAPEAKPSLPAPEAKPSLPAPEAKPSLPAPEAGPA